MTSHCIPSAPFALPAAGEGDPIVDGVTHGVIGEGAHPEGAKLSMWIALGCFVLAVATLKGGLPRVSRQ